MTKKILVIDDSSTIRRFFEIVLKKTEYEFDFAENGVKGIDKIKNFLPDVIFLDANMPELDGWEVLKYIRNNNPQIYVVMMTADEEIPDTVKLNSILKKPFQMSDLNNIISQLS